MKIGVLSDTHSREIPSQVLECFKDVDFIIHAGDFCDIEDFEILRKFKDVKGVCGNMDSHELRKVLPMKTIVNVDSVAIGIIHGEGAPDKVCRFAKDEFEKDKVDVIIFGHSHFPFQHKYGKILYFNPGSPNDLVFAPYRSFGVLEVEGKSVKGEIVKIED